MPQECGYPGALVRVTAPRHGLRIDAARPFGTCPFSAQIEQAAWWGAAHPRSAPRHSLTRRWGSAATTHLGRRSRDEFHVDAEAVFLELDVTLVLIDARRGRRGPC